MRWEKTAVHIIKSYPSRHFWALLIKLLADTLPIYPITHYNTRMTNTQALSLANTDWQAKIAELETALADLRPQLVEAEAELADRLAAINAFEFELRAKLGPLSRRLEALEKEIKKLERQVKLLSDQWDALDEDPLGTVWKMGKGAAEEGDYRYRERPSKNRQVELAPDEAVTLKKLYRELARRFHPDMAIDEADRDYRTQMMMAINAAYAAGDLAKLEAIQREPEMIQESPFSTLTDQQTAERLTRELRRVQQRLKEITQELARLQQHRSSKMMKQTQQMAAEGLDFFAIQAENLLADVARLTGKRDELQNRIDHLELDEPVVTDEDIADLVWDATLDQMYDDGDTADSDRYIRRRTDRVYFEEDFNDDIDYD